MRLSPVAIVMSIHANNKRLEKKREDSFTLETAVISHIACCGYARSTLATIVMRTVKTSSLEWHTLEMSCEKAVRNWYGAKLAQCSPTTALILLSSCRICRSARPAVEETHIIRNYLNRSVKRIQAESVLSGLHYSPFSHSHTLAPKSNQRESMRGMA